VPLLASLLLLQQPAVDSARLRHANGIPPAITAVRVTRPPVLDGRLDDSAWALATPITTCARAIPKKTTSSPSPRGRVLYDAAALYIGVRLFDREPAKIAKHLGRRDSFTQSDDFRVLIDSTTTTAPPIASTSRPSASKPICSSATTATSPTSRGIRCGSRHQRGRSWMDGRVPHSVLAAAVLACH